jgi:hypothetical protein
LRFIKAAVLTLPLALVALSATVPRVAVATELPPGVKSCDVVGGVWTCYGYDNTACADVDGVYTCSASPGTGGGGLNAGGTSGLGQVLKPSVGASGSGWLSKLTTWLSDIVHTLFSAIVDLLKDLVTYVIRVVLDLIVSAISAIGAPNFLQTYSLGNVLGQAGPVVGFFLTQLKIAQGLAMIGAGYVFRLTRKFLTLFQW